MFEVTGTNGRARQGKLTTTRGMVETPAFMPIATKGAVKTISASDLRDLGAEIILSNTFHLSLKPGVEAMKRHGGLHRLMGWNGPLLTDSGGFQVFSLASFAKTSEEGVRFRSPFDGSTVELTPERSVAMQTAIGSDIQMVFDDVAAGSSSRERYEQAMERSLRWAKRSREAFVSSTISDTLQFGIVQGGVHQDLRSRSLDGLREVGFDGYAIGGLSVGEAREQTYGMVEWLAPQMPAGCPRYFMGGGRPEEIVFYASCGIDLFDCVLPTRNARHGMLFVRTDGPLSFPSGCVDGRFYEEQRITLQRFAFVDEPIDAHCDCSTCKTTSKAYLHFLFETNEMLGMRLATIHNLRFYLALMEEMRGMLGAGV